MAELHRALLRKLADWNPDGCPVTSFYLTVDGRRYPRKADYEVRLEELLRRARAQAHAAALGRDQARSVEQDLTQVSSFVRQRFERGSTRGLALFSASAAKLWEEVRLPRPIRDRAVVGPQADLLQLESLIETYSVVCTALVDYEKARIFVSELGRIEEVTGVWDDVPKRHDQGGWAQMRFQRHVDDIRKKHLKHVAEVLFRLLKRRTFDHLVLAGSDEAVADFERELHRYLAERVRARIHLPIGASSDEVLGKSLALEEELERQRERARIEQLAAGGSRAVSGLPATLSALAEVRVGELLVSIDLSVPGFACAACGRLAEHDGRCPSCGETMQPVHDVVEAAVVQAFRQGCRVETVAENGALAAIGGIGALLRY